MLKDDVILYYVYNGLCYVYNSLTSNYNSTIGQCSIKLDESYYSCNCVSAKAIDTIVSYYIVIIVRYNVSLCAFHPAGTRSHSRCWRWCWDTERNWNYGCPLTCSGNLHGFLKRIDILTSYLHCLYIVVLNWVHRVLLITRWLQCDCMIQHSDVHIASQLYYVCIIVI